MAPAVCFECDGSYPARIRPFIAFGWYIRGLSARRTSKIWSAWDDSNIQDPKGTRFQSGGASIYPTTHRESIDETAALRTRTSWGWLPSHCKSQVINLETQ